MTKRQNCRKIVFVLKKENDTGYKKLFRDAETLKNDTKITEEF